MSNRETSPLGLIFVIGGLVVVGIAIATIPYLLSDNGTGSNSAPIPRDNDLEVNVLKGKKLTNVRASGTDEAIRLTTPLQMTLERSLAYIADDELVEVTPENIRLRKIHLDPHERKRAAKAANA